MSVQRNIFWRYDLSQADSQIARWLRPSRFVTLDVFANIHVVICYNQGSILDFQEMAGILREVNPDIRDGEVKCSRITTSSYCYGGTIASWNGVIEYRKYAGWRDTHNNPEYYWA